MRTTKLKLPRSYLERAARGGAFGGANPVPAAERPFEFMLNALRLNVGVEADLFEARTGLPLATIAAPLERARRRGWLVGDDTRLQPTADGRRLLNDLLQLFLGAA